jgi:hypothetical protein
MKSQKFFRYVWRVDAVLILAAAGIAVFGIGSLLLEEFVARSAQVRDQRKGIPLGAPESNENLTLERAVLVSGTGVLRANLVTSREGRGFSSGGYNETRNILFIDPNQKAAHWLLPDNDHVISETTEVTDERNPMVKPVIATVVLVKPESSRSEAVNGRLLLFDSGGTKVVEVGKDVNEFHVASLVSNDINVLYERDRRFVLADFDSSSLAKKTEREIDVPQLK